MSSTERSCSALQPDPSPGTDAGTDPGTGTGTDPAPAPHQVVQRALLYGDILDSIRESYVEDNVDVDQLFQTGVNAMLQVR